MNAEIINVNALAGGFSANPSSEAIASECIRMGIGVPFVSTTLKERRALCSSLYNALVRSEIVFIIGGLDSVSAEAVCEVTGLALKQNDARVKTVSEYFDRNLLSRGPGFDALTHYPDGAVLLENAYGIEDGFAVESNSKSIIVLPDVTDEATAIFRRYLVSYIHALADNRIKTSSLSVFGVSEYEILNAVKRAEACGNEVYFSTSGGVADITVVSRGADINVAQNNSRAAVSLFKNEFGNAVFSENGEGLANTTVALLKEKGLTVATAESCTGGMVSEIITSVSGASGVIEMGICAYSNRIKRDALSVPDDILDKYGAVSAQTAGYMALGIKNLSGAALGVGITGVAGPKQSESKKVGTVYVAVTDGVKTFIRHLDLEHSGDRDAIRKYSACAALDILRRYALFGDTLCGGCEANGPFSALEAQPDTAKSAKSKQTGSTQRFFPGFGNDNLLADQLEQIMSVPEDNDEEEEMLDVGTTDEDVYSFEERDFTDTSRYDYDVSARPIKLKSTFPKKSAGENKTRAEKIVKAVSAAVAAVLVLVCSLLTLYFTEGTRSDRLIAKTRETYVSEGAGEKAYDTLSAANPDYRGWLKIGDVDHPVYQAADNDYYLERNLKKKKNRFGALYFDYRDIVSDNGTSQNLVIYGKSPNGKSMFGSLSKYKTLEYLKANSTVTFSMRSTKTTYEIFSVFIINSVPEDDNGYLFNFIRGTFPDTEAFEQWIAEARERSLFITESEVKATDKILTLVTTTGEFDNARLVIMAKSVKGTVPGSFSARVNPSPRYPAAWYKAYGHDEPTSSTDEPEVPDTSDVSDEPDESSEHSSSEGSSSRTSSSKPASKPSSQTSSRTTPSGETSGTTSGGTSSTASGETSGTTSGGTSSTASGETSGTTSSETSGDTSSTASDEPASSEPEVPETPEQ